MATDLQQVRACCGRMHDMLVTVSHYVEDVIVSVGERCSMVTVRGKDAALCQVLVDMTGA